MPALGARKIANSPQTISSSESAEAAGAAGAAAEEESAATEEAAGAERLPRKSPEHHKSVTNVFLKLRPGGPPAASAMHAKPRDLGR